jgi:hypothetical protein
MGREREYRGRAEELRRMAAEAKEPHARDEFLTAAKAWDRLAEEAERNGRRYGPGKQLVS